MKKALSLAMAAAMTMGLAACGSTASSTAAADSTPASSAAESEATPAADGKVYNIGICQLVQHEALDAATQGFKDALTEKLGADNVKFDEQNASGDSANCTTIVSGFVSTGVDLILANATAPLQAAAQATADIPARDFRTMQFLDWFVKEQGEEEKNAADLIKKMELFGSEKKGLYMLDQELAARVYAAPSLTL